MKIVKMLFILLLDSSNNCILSYIHHPKPLWSTGNHGIKSSLLYSQILKSFFFFCFIAITGELKRDTGIKQVLRQNTTLSKLEYSTQHSLFAQIINQDFFWTTKLGAGLLVISHRVL